MKLVLGVNDIPYASPPKSMRRHKNQKVVSGTQTTGDVAQWLENKYHVMQNFVDFDEEKIMDALIESIGGQIDSMQMGAPMGDPFLSANQEITALFKTFLSDGSIETMGVGGVPTEAALNGVNHRLKAGKGDQRPSFIDTSLYQQSFVAEVTK